LVQTRLDYVDPRLIARRRRKTARFSLCVTRCICKDCLGLLSLSMPSSLRLMLHITQNIQGLELW